MANNQDTKKSVPELNRLKALARLLTLEDLKALEAGKPVLISGYSPVMPQDLEKIDQACPGWRKRLESREEGKDNVVYLPAWPELVRGVPNGFLRSALFGIVAKGKRRYLENERIDAIDGIEVYYTGQKLDQMDLDVYENLLHLARQQALGSCCRVTSYRLLKLLGKNDDGRNRKLLQLCILRLKATAVVIKCGRYSYIGSLLDEGYKDEETQEWVIVLNPKIKALFAPDQYTQINWEVRRKLGPLAKWLHGFYASHAKPYPIRVETLHRLCGSETKDLFHFRAKLRAALQTLQAVTGWTCTIDENDLVHINKTPKK